MSGNASGLSSGGAAQTRLTRLRVDWRDGEGNWAVGVVVSVAASLLLQHHTLQAGPSSGVQRQQQDGVHGDRRLPFTYYYLALLGSFILTKLVCLGQQEYYLCTLCWVSFASSHARLTGCVS